MVVNNVDLEIPYNFLEAYPYPAFVLGVSDSSHDSRSSIASSSRSQISNDLHESEPVVLWANEEWQNVSNGAGLDELLGTMAYGEFINWLRSVSKQKLGQLKAGWQMYQDDQIGVIKDRNGKHRGQSDQTGTNNKIGHFQPDSSDVPNRTRGKSFSAHLHTTNIKLEMTATFLSSKTSPTHSSNTSQLNILFPHPIIVTCTHVVSATQQHPATLDVRNTLDSRPPVESDTVAINPSIRAPNETVTDVHELLRCTDWSKTSLGPQDQWPSSLNTIVSIVMAYPKAAGSLAKHPEIFGRPGSVAFAEVWDKVQPLAKHVMSGTPVCLEDDFFLLDTGEENGNRLQEQYYTWLWIPIWQEDGSVGGLLNTGTETTAKVLSKRRGKTINDVIELTSSAKSLEQFDASIIDSFEPSPHDVPFAALYRANDHAVHPAQHGQATFLGDRSVEKGNHTSEMHLCATVGIPQGHLSFPAVVRPNFSSSSDPSVNTSPEIPKLESQQQDSGRKSSPIIKEEINGPLQDRSWPIQQALNTRQIVLVEKCRHLIEGLSPRIWDDLPDSAVVIPITNDNHEDVKPAVLIIGLNYHRPLDEDYETFLQILRIQLTSSLITAKASEDQLHRIEQLDALNKAKTHLSASISHEFRTPLTLIKGPIDDLLGVIQDPQQVEWLSLAQRNVGRLNRLINSLMDVTKLEAQKLTGTFRLVNLGILTHRLAYMFQCVIDKTNLDYRITCDQDQRNVYVDPEHWEKIVLNLINNAMKYTMQGFIHVILRYHDAAVILEICDSGVGIPSQDLKHIGTRFHRVSSTSRSHEGTGIGLFLVKELARLHGGVLELSSVTEAESDDGTHGSTFRIKIPLGSDHLPPEHVVDEPYAPDLNTPYGDNIITEARSWTSRQDTLGMDKLSLSQQKPRTPRSEYSTGELNSVGRTGLSLDASDTVLIVDDSHALRQYLCSIFAPHCQVIEAEDGAKALDICYHSHPQLIISDVMMPNLDGFGLLQALKTSPILKSIPVIMLTARGGDENKVDGLLAGAEDYLSKPFNKEELLTRAQLQILLGKKRKQLEEAVEVQTQETRAILDHSPVGLFRTDQHGHLLSVNSAWYDISGHPGDSDLNEWSYLIADSSKKSVTAYWTNLFVEGAEPTSSLDFQLETGRWVTAKMTRLDPITTGLKGYLGCLTDISDRVEHENAQKHKVIEAEQRRLAAEDAKRQQELLIDITSHEIRNPISIKTNLSTFEEQLQACLDQGTKFIPTAQLLGIVKEDLDALESIYQCGLAQERICNDVLSLGRIQLDMLQMFDVQINLQQEAQKVISIFQSEARMKRISLSLTMGQSISDLGVECIKLDPVRLGQVLTNLLSNGIRFTSNSTIRRIELKLDVSYEKPTDGSCAPPPAIQIESNGTGNQPIFLYASVTDTGPGMNLEELELLFQRFSQVSPKTHTIFGGSGLGLFVCRKITDIMGGRIEVLSEQGKGSTFRFFVEARTCDVEDCSSSPSKSPSEKSKAKPVRPAKMTRAGTMLRITNLIDGNEKPRILIVEDNLINQTVLARQLKHVGFSVEVANHGLEALEKIRKVSSKEGTVGDAQFDCVIMDLEMPIMDGLTAVHILREEESAGTLSRSSVLALTGNARQGQIDEAKACGMDEVVIKPYKLDDLLLKVEDVMKMRAP